MKGRLNLKAVEFLVQHPGLLSLNREILTKHLIRVGLFSQKTYWKDIRIERLRNEANRLIRTANTSGRGGTA